jgi:hypothetical protein
MAAQILPDEFRCSYPFKFCNKPRAIKKSGDPHKLCQEHRDKANKHQKDLAARRRQIKIRLERSSESTAGSRSLDKRLSFDDISDLLDDDTFLHVECNAEDLRAIETLLSDSDSD